MSKAVEILAGVYDFYGKDLSDFAMRVWFEAVKGFESEQVSKAFSAHLMDPENGKWLPKPGDIVRQLQGTYTDRAMVQWGNVVEAMRTVGGHRSVVFDDPATMAAIQDIGGWQMICADTEENLPHLQRRFAASYGAYAKRPGHPYPAKLVGRNEEHNKLHGHAFEPAVMIGHPGVCGAILMDGSHGPKTQISVADAVKRIA